MNYTKVEFKVPQLEGEKFSKKDLEMFFAVRLCEVNILDSGYAAEMIGMGRSEFLHKMGKYGKSVFEIEYDNMAKEELEKEFENA